MDNLENFWEFKVAKKGQFVSMDRQMDNLREFLGIHFKVANKGPFVSMDRQTDG